MGPASVDAFAGFSSPADAGLGEAVFSCGISAPQLPQKFSSGAILAPHLVQRTICKLPEEPELELNLLSERRRFLPDDAEPQKRLADNNFIAIM